MFMIVPIDAPKRFKGIKIDTKSWSMRVLFGLTGLYLNKLYKYLTRVVKKL